MSKLAQVLKSHTDVNGTTLYDHINNFLFEVLQTNHQDLSTVELLSDFTKKNRFLFKTQASDKDVNNLKSPESDYNEWASKVATLLNTQTVAEMPTILQDFVTAARMLEVAGLGFGEEETYKIQLSIKQLAIETKAEELVFFGKILCRNNDYFIARGVVPKLPTDQLGPDVEIRGDGTNLYTFWVTHDVLTDWIELPLSTPAQIRGVREIKYIFTGDLNAEIKAYPTFPGKEKHFLKAQLTRICHANLIAPKGLYRMKEENPKEFEFEEEFKLPEFAELANPENWIHLPAQILKAGRITHYPDPNMSEEAKANLAEADPEAERLKSITEDRPLEPLYQTNWLVKVIGDQQQYGAKEEGANNNVYATTFLKNYTWPGAVTVANQNGWANFYLGYGFKETQAQFVPIQNNDLQVEPEDREECYEPNPKNPPKPPVVENENPENPDGEGQQEQDQEND